MVTEDDKEDEEDDVESSEDFRGSKGSPVGEKVTVHSIHQDWDSQDSILVLQAGSLLSFNIK